MWFCLFNCCSGLVVLVAFFYTSGPLYFRHPQLLASFALHGPEQQEVHDVFQTVKYHFWRTSPGNVQLIIQMLSQLPCSFVSSVHNTNNYKKQNQTYLNSSTTRWTLNIPWTVTVFLTLKRILAQNIQVCYSASSRAERNSFLLLMKQSVCARACACARGWDMTGTLNAHIWSEFTSVLLAELNSFYRLEQIPSLTQVKKKEGSFSENNQWKKTHFSWLPWLVHLFPLHRKKKEKKNMNVLSEVWFWSKERRIFLNDPSCQHQSPTAQILALH